MARLKQSLRIQSRVKRDGTWSTIPARELVPGDIVRARIGDLLPADIKIIDGSLGLDQSVLTGESGIVDKLPAEIAYSGSAVKRGEATGIVETTGIKTYFGKTISPLELRGFLLWFLLVIFRLFWDPQLQEGLLRLFCRECLLE
jgi:H+-transporting ATPase